eukprot:CAMPEP_0118665172 /NCGR_PEP_ID=MMETSP0785-20121206/18472_1 /TAXON_ID=91992 /ORGANISM="Bolidomonas pacifica, Strain CCMP 1866" /LENGTH=537 /DNA_ID=CAMNT_0006559263 /DNA_START=386 /DNA_END=1999 /DNA_ORIENTATION=+
MVVLLSLIEVFRGHSETVSLRIQDSGGTRTPSSDYFYNSLSIHTPPHLQEYHQDCSLEEAPPGSLSAPPPGRSLSSDICSNSSEGERQWRGSSSPAAGSSPKSPMSYRKLSSVQLNDNKFVFAVENPETEKEYIMKETTVTSNDHLDTVMKEFHIINLLHSEGQVSGIINQPECFEENIRSTMVYDMHTCDLFNYLNEYCNTKQTKGVPEEAARVWVAQLLYVVGAMVKKNIAHRDLKPENILLDSKCNIVVTDFELAREIPDGIVKVVDGDLSLVGTPLYIPPEIGAKKFADVSKYDIWSLGVIAWELVTDVNPWGINVDAMGPHDILQRTNRTSKLDVSVKPPGMSDTYFDFIRSLVCKHSERSTIEVAMSHDLFKDVDFSDPAALFQSKGVHSEFASVLPVLQRLKGAQKKKMFADKKVCTPNTSPHPLHRSAPGLGSSGILNEEEAKMIRRELIKLECWKRQQRLIPTAETQQKIAAQNEILRQYTNVTEIRRMSEPSSEGEVGQGSRSGVRSHNRHRKLSMTGEKNGRKGRA